MKTIILSLMMATVLSAASISWGDETVTDFSVTDCFGNALVDASLASSILTPDANGISSHLSINFGSFVTPGFSISSTYAIRRAFTVTGDGNFRLDQSGIEGASGLICNPGHCDGVAAYLTMNSLGIWATNYQVLPVPPPSDPTFDDFVNDHLFSELTIDAGSSSTVFFSHGTYELDQNIYSTASSPEYPGVDQTATTDLLPIDEVPEPPYYMLLLPAILLIIGLVLVRRKK